VQHVLVGASRQVICAVGVPSAWKASAVMKQCLDKFCWKWSSSGECSASSAYQAFFIGQSGVLGAKELHKTRAPPPPKFFDWLALLGRSWTSERLQRHNLPNNGDCTLCSQGDELLSHLPLSCVYSREVWARCLRACNLLQLQPGGDDELGAWWIRSCK
jgi:hypothetical protein